LASPFSVFGISVLFHQTICSNRGSSDAENLDTIHCGGVGYKSACICVDVQIRAGMVAASVALTVSSALNWFGILHPSFVRKNVIFAVSGQNCLLYPH